MSQDTILISTQFAPKYAVEQIRAILPRNLQRHPARGEGYWQGFGIIGRHEIHAIRNDKIHLDIIGLRRGGNDPTLDPIEGEVSVIQKFPSENGEIELPEVTQTQQIGVAGWYGKDLRRAATITLQASGTMTVIFFEICDSALTPMFQEIADHFKPRAREENNLMPQPTLLDETVPAQSAYVKRVIADFFRDTENSRIAWTDAGALDCWQVSIADAGVRYEGGIWLSVQARAFYQESAKEFRADIHPVTVGHVEILPQTPEKSRVVIICDNQSDIDFARLFEKLGGYILERTDSKERSLKWRMQQLGARLPKEYHTPTESSAPTEQPTWRGNSEPPKTRAEKIKAIQAWDAIPRDERPPLADWLIENFGTDPATENQNVIESTFHSWRRLKNS